MADPFNEADGRQLAVDMMRELVDEWNSHNLDGVADDGIGEAMINREPATMRRYMAIVREKNSPALERGFLCVLSNYIGGSVEVGEIKCQHE